MSVSQSSSLVHLHSTPDCRPGGGNLWAPPLPFRRQPPQLNCPPGAVPDPDHGPGLEAQHTKSGISRLAPPEPESGLHSLPPILRNVCRTSTPSCSKGPGVFPSCRGKRASLLVVQFRRVRG